MIGEQKQSEYGGSDTLSVKIPKWMSDLLNMIAKGMGDDVTANHILALCIQCVVEAAKCDGPVPTWLRLIIDMLKLDTSWHKAFNFGSTECQMDVAQIILVLQQHDGKQPRKGFGLAMIDKPFMGDAHVTYCVDDILERVTEVSMKGLYKRLRQIGVELESQSLRETLTIMCDAQSIVNLEEQDRNELPGYGDRHDYGKAIEYGRKFKRKPRRTPDSLANSQQLKLFDPDKPYGEQADKYLADLEERARAERSEMMEDDLGFKPFDQEP